MESISIRKTHQFIVILLENQSYVHDSRKNSKTFLMDKIRFDFNDKVALKLICLKMMPGEILNSIPECIDVISNCVYHSALMNLNQMDDDIRKLSSQRNSPGWNFCTFFLTKESKALSLFEMGLFSEAVACYDELEALFFEVETISSERNVTNDLNQTSAFESSIPLNSSISGNDLNSSNWSKFRELIHHNRISLYEFQVYLFSRQFFILLETQDYEQILKRLKQFVCGSIFTRFLDDTMRKKWILEIIFFALRIFDLDASKVDVDDGLSNTLSDILLLADTQV